MEKMGVWTKVSLVLAIIGALNWGLIGLFNWNLVNALFGGPTAVDGSWLARVIYVVVGLAGLALVAFSRRLREIHGAPLRREAAART